MSTIVEKIQDHLDPSSAANAFHEVMLLWKEADDAVSHPHQRPDRYNIRVGERQAYEKVLSIFLGVNRNRVRQTMREHYKETRHG